MLSLLRKKNKNMKKTEDLIHALLSNDLLTKEFYKKKKNNLEFEEIVINPIILSKQIKQLVRLLQFLLKSSNNEGGLLYLLVKNKYYIYLLSSLINKKFLPNNIELQITQSFTKIRSEKEIKMLIELDTNFSLSNKIFEKKVELNSIFLINQIKQNKSSARSSFYELNIQLHNIKRIAFLIILLKKTLSYQKSNEKK